MSRTVSERTNHRVCHNRLKFSAFLILVRHFRDPPPAGFSDKASDQRVNAKASVKLNHFYPVEIQRKRLSLNLSTYVCKNWKRVVSHSRQDEHRTMPSL